MPNVGKSTLFNALVENAKAQAANFPFCTIEPNLGVVTVPDERVNKLTSLVNPQKTVPTIINFAMLLRKSANDCVENSLFNPVNGLILLNLGASALMVKRIPT